MENNTHRSSTPCFGDAEDADLRALFKGTMPMAPVIDAGVLFAQLEARSAATQACSKTDAENRESEALKATLSDRGRFAMWRRVAAVFVAAGAIVAAFVLPSTSSTTRVLAEAQEALEKVRSVTYTITETVGDKPAEIMRCSVLGQELVRAERADGAFFVLDLKQGKMLEVIPQQSRAVVTEELEVPEHFSVMARIRSLNRHAARIQPGVPERDFGQREASGFVVELDGVEYNIWLDQETHLPLRLESRGKGIERTWGDFVYNKNLDSSLFSLRPPKGFEVEHRTFAEARRSAQERAAREALERAKMALEKARAKAKKESR